MTPVQGGRHCAHCSKTVVDFSRMTDAALLDYVRRNGLGCGQFREDQLKRNIRLPLVRKRIVLLKYAAGILLTLGFTKELHAQRKTSSTDTVQYPEPFRGSKDYAESLQEAPVTQEADSNTLLQPYYRKNGEVLFLGGGIASGNTVIVMRRPAPGFSWRRLMFWRRLH